MSPKELDSYLIEAATHGEKQSCIDALSRGANVNATDPVGWTPLHYAASRGFINISRLLVAAGANVNAISRRNSTPIVFSITSARKSMDVCRFLIDAGTDVGLADDIGRTPLHHAAAESNVEACRLLVNKGACVQVRDDTGMTPLQLAITVGALPSVKYFMQECSAYTNQTPTEIQALAQLATESGRLEMAQFLAVCGNSLRIEQSIHAALPDADAQGRPITSRTFSPL